MTPQFVEAGACAFQTKSGNFVILGVSEVHITALYHALVTP